MISISLLFVWFSCLLPTVHPERWTNTTSPQPSSRSWLTKSLNGEETAIHLTEIDNHIVSIHINISRQDCEPFQDVNVTESILALDIIHKHYGPDEILIYFEGPVLQAKIPAYHGCNLYGTNFTVTIPGTYRLKVLHTRCQYSAVDEIAYRTKPPLMEYFVMLDDAVDVIIDDQEINSNEKCSQSHWVAIQPQYMLTTPEIMTLNNYKNMLGDGFNPNLQLYTYINLTTLSATETGKHRCGNCTFVNFVCEDHKLEVFDTYDWLPACDNSYFLERIRSDNLTSHHPTIIHTNLSMAAQLLSGKTILFVGDSQMRTFAGAFRAWACADDHPCNKFSMQTFDEQFCNTEKLPHASSLTVLMMNCGQWPAAHFHYTYDQYFNLVENFVKNLTMKGYTQSNFVWAETFFQPFRNDHFARSSLDWRTHHRIHLFNHLADKAFHGTNFVQLSSLWSLVVAEKFCDNAHFTAINSMVPLMQQLLTFLRRFHG